MDTCDKNKWHWGTASCTTLPILPLGSPSVRYRRKGQFGEWFNIERTISFEISLPVWNPSMSIFVAITKKGVGCPQLHAEKVWSENQDSFKYSGT